MELFDSLLDDETLLRRQDLPVAAMVADHLALRKTYGRLIATLVSPDRQLAELARHIPADLTVPVSVIISGGAGGLLGLARRDLPGVGIVSAEPALRDLDDLAGNAARVVSAAAELGNEVAIFVDLPYAPGWKTAVELVEAAGLYGKILYGKIASDEAEPRQTAEQLSFLIEADLPFKISSRSATGWSALLTTVAALIDGASIEDAADLMQRRPQHQRAQHQSGATASVWAQTMQSQTMQARIRRRLRRLGTDPIREVVSDYVAEQSTNS
jgi:hypothetical protein